MNKKYIACIFALVLAATSLHAQDAEAATNAALSYPSFVPMSSPNLSTQDMNALIAYIRSVMEWYRQDVLGQVGSSVDDSHDSSEMTVKTNNADHIDDERATVSGRVDLNDSDYADMWFEYGTQSSNLSSRTSRIREDDNDGDIIDFESKLTGLDDDRTYYYRAIARDDNGDTVHGSVKTFHTDDSSDSSSDDTETPSATTRAADGIGRYSATLHGAIDMHDFENGTVFYVYGTDESLVADADSYDTYDAIDEDGTDLQKERIDSDLDDDSSYWYYVSDLDTDTTYYFAIGVAYEDEDGDEVIRLGSVREFTTND